MERRSFLKQTAVGAAALVAAPAAVMAAEETAGLPTISWRLTSSFPKSLDTIFGASDMLADGLS